MSEESYIQNLFAERIGGNSFGKDTAIYKFEKIKRAKLAAKAEKPDTPIIDMGVGELDEMAFPEVVNALQTAVAKPENRGYADNGRQPSNPLRRSGWKVCSVSPTLILRRRSCTRLAQRQHYHYYPSALSTRGTLF